MANPTVDTSFKASGLSCRIVPFKAVFNDDANVTHLRVAVTNNNMKDSAQIFWEVLSEDGKKRASGVLSLKDADYTSLVEDKMYAFTYVANSLGLTFA